MVNLETATACQYLRVHNTWKFCYLEMREYHKYDIEDISLSTLQHYHYRSYSTIKNGYQWNVSKIEAHTHGHKHCYIRICRPQISLLAYFYVSIPLSSRDITKGNFLPHWS